MPYPKTLLLSVLLIGCSDKGGDFEPQEGSWTISPTTLDDGCGMDFGEQDDGQGDLSMNSDGKSFTITDTEGDDSGGPDSFNCELDGQDFECDDGGDETMDLNEDGMDAIIEMEFTVGGSFTSETEGTFYTKVDISCEGADCDTAAGFFDLDSFPCTTTQNYDVSAD